MKIKCPLCDKSEINEIVFDFETSQIDPVRKEKIVVKNARKFECSACQTQWFSRSQEEYVDNHISKVLHKPLSTEEIQVIRKSLPFRTKKQLADFLCLNEKAFVRWEKGYNRPNLAYDLLLRLVAFSEENYLFMKTLHEKNFRFDQQDYYFVREYGRREDSTGEKILGSYLVRHFEQTKCSAKPFLTLEEDCEVQEGADHEFAIAA